MTRTRWIIILVFLVGLISQVLALSSTYLAGDIRSGTLQKLLLVVLTLYSVPLGSILGGVFAKPALPKGKERAASGMLAIVLALLWNGLLVARTLIYAFGGTVETPDALTQYLSTVAAASMFLISGSLTYYFVKETS